MSGTRTDTPEAWMAMCCSRCHVCLNWDGRCWTCPKCHAYWKTKARLMQGRRAVGYINNEKEEK